MESALAFIGERLRMGRIDVKSMLSPANPMVQGCPVQLEQVFVNLLANALDAMKDSRAKLIRIATAVENGSVCIQVKDTGTGIPADILSRIFDPFFTTKEVGLGTGLGLSISYGILKEHHGDITVQSVVGHGTEFLIHLPLHE
jgi:signal transduction histidine kinase